jgi:hypothetical protein
VRALAVTAAALALVAAGCSNDDDGSFRSDYEKLDRALGELGQTVHAALQNADTKSPPAVARQFDRLALALARLRSRLAELEPPAEVEDDVAKLEATMAATVEALRELGAAADGGSPRAVRLRALALLRRGERLDALQARVEEKTEGG